MTVATLEKVEAELSKWNNYVEEPSGSNKTIFNKWFYKANTAAAWCHIYITYGFHMAGFTDFPKTAYTPSGAVECLKKWRKVRADERLRKGDVIYYYWTDMGRIAHIGWFSHYEGDYLRVWEGNTDGGGSRTGGKVMLQRRSRATINEKLGGLVVRVEYSKSLINVSPQVMLEEEMRPVTMSAAGVPGVYLVMATGSGLVKLHMADAQDLRNPPDGYGPVVEVNRGHLEAVPFPDGTKGLV